MIIIKRENFAGKYFVVARENGKFVSRKKWSKKFSIKKAKSIFASNQTFQTGIIRVSLKNVVEIFDYRDKPKRPRGLSQYVVEGRFQDGSSVIGRSLQHDATYPKRKIRNEAWDNFYMLLSAKINDEVYDPDIGQGIAANMLAKGKIKIREGWVFYRDKSVKTNKTGS